MDKSFIAKIYVVLLIFCAYSIEGVCFSWDVLQKIPALPKQDIDLIVKKISQPETLMDFLVNNDEILTQLHNTFENAILTASTKNSSQANMAVLWDFRNKLYDDLKQSPLCLFSECFGASCPLNREKHAQRRWAYQQAVATTMLQKYKNQSELTYMSVGAGYLLQDFLIVNQALSLLPSYKKYSLTIHFIDPSIFSHYITVIKNIAATFLSKEYIPGAFLSMPMLQLDYVAQILEKKPELLDQEALKKNRLKEIFGVMKDLLLVDARLKQWASWFRGAYPFVALRLCIHSDIDYYGKMVAAGQAGKIDILVASDIDDVRAYEDFHKARLSYLNPSGFVFGTVHPLTPGIQEQIKEAQEKLKQIESAI